MYSNITNIPLSLAVWLAIDDYDHNPDPMVISATSLLKPIRSLILSQRVDKDLKTDLSTMIASRVGTAVHTAIEMAWKNHHKEALIKLGYPNSVEKRLKINPNPDDVELDDLPVYMELRSYKEIGGYKISGKFDFVADGQLRDFKTTSTFSLISGSNDQKYIEQGSIYRWLNPKIILNDRMCIDFIFTDWSAMKAKVDKSYPQSKIVAKEFPLLSMGDTELLIHRKLAAVIKYKDLPEEDLPLCTRDELWQRDTVYKYYKNPKSKTRSTKNFTNMAEANVRLAKDGSVGEVIAVPGEVVFCRFCPANSCCAQAEQFVLEGLLKF